MPGEIASASRTVALPRSGAETFGRTLPWATAALLTVHVILAGYLGLTEDEAYYRLWSLAPSLSYLDHPPMVAWLIAVGRYLAGEGELGVRLLAPLLMAAGAALQWRLSCRLADRQTANVSTWFYLAAPLLNVGGIIITPDLPSVLFYGLVTFGLCELERTRNANWWLAIGVFAGCGLLSKYTNLFAGASILIWLLAVPANRKWFAAPQLWAGGLIALALFTPVAIWNAQHDWASFAKQFGRVATNSGLRLVFAAELAGGLLLLLSPVIAALAMWGLGSLTGRAVSTRSSKSVLIAASVLPLLLYFAAHALHGRVQGNWLAPLYPLLCLCAAIAWSSLDIARRRIAFLLAVSLGFATTAALYTHAVMPLAALRKDPTGQMRGWPAFKQALLPHAMSTHAGWIATSSYATTAQLTYELRALLPVAQLNERIRHEHLPLLSRAATALPALYVELERRSSEPLLATCFARFKPLGTLFRADGTVSQASYKIYLAEGLKESCAHEAAPLHAAAIAAPGDSVPTRGLAN